MNKRAGILVVFGAAILFLCLIFGKILFHPQEYLFAPGGDGIKNYFSVLYFVKYDAGIWLTGMNYPYGDHLIYPDAQPALAIMLKWISNHIAALSPTAVVGIMNFLMLFSIAATAVVIFLILKHYRLPLLFAVAGALLIAFLAPQIIRIRGHYALSYGFYLPLIFYLLIRLYSKHSFLLQALGLVVLMFIFSLIHPYYLPIGALFVSLFAIVYGLQNGFEQKRELLAALASCAGAFLLFKMFLWVTDPVADRPEAPWGFFFYTASFESVFFPPNGPVFDFLDSIVKIRRGKFEGYAYVGITGVFVLLLILAKWVRYALKKRYALIFKPVLPPTLAAAFWASALILIFSMSIPFKWGLEFVVDWLKPVQQFRSVGRFAWIFYYVFTVLIVYLLYLFYRYLRMRGRVKPAYLLLLFAFGIWGWEAYRYGNQIKNEIKPLTLAKDYLKGQDIEAGLQKNGYNINDFQAILALPFFNLGSEQIYINERSGNSLYYGMQAALETGLPLVSQYSARSSISQSLKATQLLSHPWIEKSILKDLPNNLPFLLITADPITFPDEKRLMAFAKPIFETGLIKAYELPLKAFETAYPQIEAPFFRQEDLWTTDTASAIVWRSFENNIGAAFWGKGAFSTKESEAVIYDNSLTIPSDSVKYDFSLWVKTDPSSAGYPTVTFKRFLNEQLVSEKRFHPTLLTDIDEDWIRVADTFSYGKGERIEISIKGQNIHVDEFLIKPAHVDVFKRTKKGKMLVNNFRIDANKFFPALIE